MSQTVQAERTNTQTDLEDESTEAPTTHVAGAAESQQPSQPPTPQPGIVTLDRPHFSVVRPIHTDPFELCPQISHHANQQIRGRNEHFTECPRTAPPALQVSLNRDHGRWRCASCGALDLPVPGRCRASGSSCAASQAHVMPGSAVSLMGCFTTRSGVNYPS
jgi:hypothetical protein